MITHFDPCLMKVNAMIFYSKNIDLAEENVMKQADSLFVQQYSYVSDVHAHVPQSDSDGLFQPPKTQCLPTN